MNPSTRAMVAAFTVAVVLAVPEGSAGQGAQAAPRIRLPAPATDGGPPLARALARRRSVRAFAQTPLRLSEVSQLLWAAQGVTRPMPAPAGWRWGEWRG
ncbi:MAG: hypothetical protein P8174_09395, partial [Gemmatimonadota bacterium]